MHPLLLDEHVRQHQTELRRTYSPAHIRSGEWKERFGWLLVECGLRLVAARPGSLER